MDTKQHRASTDRWAGGRSRRRRRQAGCSRTPASLLCRHPHTLETSSSDFSAVSIACTRRQPPCRRPAGRSEGFSGGSGGGGSRGFEPGACSAARCAGMPRHKHAASSPGKQATAGGTIPAWIVAAARQGSPLRASCAGALLKAAAALLVLRACARGAAAAVQQADAMFRDWGGRQVSVSAAKWVHLLMDRCALQCTSIERAGAADGDLYICCTAGCGSAAAAKLAGTQCLSSLFDS